MRIQIIKVHIPAGNEEHHSAITKYLDSNNLVREKASLISTLQEIANSAFVQDKYGDIVECVIVYPANGNPYLKTRPDGTKADNLLSLPRF